LRDENTDYVVDPENLDASFCGTGSAVAETGFTGWLWSKTPVISLGVRFYGRSSQIWSIGRTTNFVLGSKATVIGHEGIHAMTGKRDLDVYDAALKVLKRSPLTLLPTSAMASEEFSKLLWEQCK
jgi:hypothetical protein